MTPKDKALKLTEKYIAPTMDRGLCGYFKSIAIAKECALITVDEFLDFLSKSQYDYVNTIAHWQQVKQEIEKI